MLHRWCKNRPGKIIESIAALAFLLLAPACNRSYHMPHANRVHSMKEDRDFHISLSLGAGDETSTDEGQASYAVTDNLAVMGSYMSATGEDGNDFGKGDYDALALGYYSAR